MAVTRSLYQYGGELIPRLWTRRLDCVKAGYKGPRSGCGHQSVSITPIRALCKTQYSLYLLIVFVAIHEAIMAKA